MYKKTFVHLNPSTGVSVVVTATTTTYANKKECIDYYVNPNNLKKEGPIYYLTE